MQYNPEYHAWFSQLSTYRCQTLALSRRCYISETAQPYQTGANRCSWTATESGRPSKKCFKQKETSYVPYPHAVTMDPGSSRQTHRRWPAPTNQGSLSLGARGTIVSHPSRGARASPWVGSQSLVHCTSPDIKLCRRPDEVGNERDPTRRGGWRNVELSNFVDEPIAIGAGCGADPSFGATSRGMGALILK